MRAGTPKASPVQPPWDYETLVQQLIDRLDRTGMPYMFIGGLAVSYWGIPRTTLDIDIVMALEVGNVVRLAAPLKALRFDIRVDALRLIARVGNTLLAHTGFSPHRVDFWIPRTEFEQEAFRRRCRRSLYGRTAWLERPEGLILMKLLAGREKDWGDAEGVWRRQRRRLDHRYLRAWATHLGLAEELARLRR